MLGFFRSLLETFSKGLRSKHLCTLTTLLMELFSKCCRPDCHSMQLYWRCDLVQQTTAAVGCSDQPVTASHLATMEWYRYSAATPLYLVYSERHWAFRCYSRRLLSQLLMLLQYSSLLQHHNHLFAFHFHSSHLLQPVVLNQCIYITSIRRADNIGPMCQNELAPMQGPLLSVLNLVHAWILQKSARNIQ